MRMIITTDYEEGAHHVSDALYKAIVTVLVDNGSFPLVIESVKTCPHCDQPLIEGACPAIWNMREAIRRKG